jgi:serine/threonine protein kinase
MAKNTYVLGKRIARGGMAEIYLGKAVGEAAFQRICAIKRILPHYSQDREFVEMFRDEAHICKRLQHANIVQVYDFTEVEGSYALIMEHVDGGDLRTLLSACEIARTRLSVPMALYICANASRALHFAHTKVDEITKEPLGIVHRDISPQNILISYEGEIKITDFGIASAENKITETRPGVVKGKYSYMSPEQVAAKPLDGRSDVFSLAIVLWEALAMKRLFAGQTEVESIRKVQNCEIPYDLRELNSEVDDELLHITLKGLAKDRKNRYQTAAAFEKDLLKYLHSRYSDFTSSELGNFLKRILAKKRDKTQDDIKETLSQLAARPAQMLKQAEREAAQAQGQAAAQQDSAAAQANAASAEAAPSQNRQPDSGTIADPQGFTRNFQPNARSVGVPVSSNSNQRRSSFQPMRSLPRGTASGRTQYPNHQYRKQASLRRNRKSRWPMILLGLFLITGSALFVRHYIFDEKLHIKIEAHPDTIRIAVNDQFIQDGYTKTPAKISLKPGTYTLRFSRPGYDSEKVRVKGKKGDTVELPKIFLKRQPFANLVPIRILSPDKRLFVNVDNGLFRGSTPMKVDLKPGVQHSISFYSGDERRRALRCTFRAQKQRRGGTQTLVIRVYRDGRIKCGIKS